MIPKYKTALFHLCLHLMTRYKQSGDDFSQLFKSILSNLVTLHYLVELPNLPHLHQKYHQSELPPLVKVI